MPITNAQQARALSRQARGRNEPDVHPLEPADGQPAPTPEQYVAAVSALTALGFTFIEYNGVPWMVW